MGARRRRKERTGREWRKEGRRKDGRKETLKNIYNHSHKIWEYATT